MSVETNGSASAPSAASAAARALLPEPATLVEKRSLGGELRVLRLRLQDAAARPRFDFQQGQFNMLYVPGVGEVALSISSDPEDPDLEHTVRIVGRTTRALDRRQVGETLGVRGPYGTAWPLQEARFKDVLVVTGGLGCAPVSGALEYLFRRRASYGRIRVLHGVKTPGDLVHRERFEAWRRQPDTQVLLTADQPDRTWRGRGGVVTELFHEVELDPGRSVAFLCGPEAMLRRAARILAGRGVPRERIFLSLERTMHCAVGLCGHCQLGPLLLCKDGPIVRYADVAWLLRVHGL